MEQTIHTQPERRLVPSDVGLDLGLWLPAGLVLVLVGAYILRLGNLDAWLWYDEVFSVSLAQLPFTKMLIATASDVHPAGYYAFLWLWGQVFGYDEIAMRLPSVLAGLVLVILVYHLARVLDLPKRGQYIATALAAFSPFAIYYSQEARMYALLMALIAGSALAMLQGRWGIFTLCGIGAVYLNNLAPFYLIGLGFGLWLAKWPPKPPKGGSQSFSLWGGIRPLIISASFIIIAYLPALSMLTRQVSALNGGYWIPTPTAGRVLSLLDELTFYSPKSPFVLATGLVTSLCLVLLIYSLPKILRSQYGPLLLAWFIVPLGLGLVVSWLWQPILISRSISGIAPAWWLLIGWTMGQTKNRAIAFTVLALPIVIAVLVIGPMLGEMGRKPKGELWWADSSIPGPADGLYHANMASYMVGRYYWPHNPQYVWPNETGLAESLTPATMEAMGIERATLESVSDQAQTWYLFYYHNPTTTQAEINYVNHLLTDYQATPIQELKNSPAESGWLYRLQEEE